MSTPSREEKYKNNDEVLKETFKKDFKAGFKYQAIFVVNSIIRTLDEMADLSKEDIKDFLEYCLFNYYDNKK